MCYDRIRKVGIVNGNLNLTKISYTKTIEPKNKECILISDNNSKIENIQNFKRPNI